MLFKRTYREFDGFDGEDRVNARDLDIVDYAVRAPDERYLVYRRSQPGDYFSELRVTGDRFTWSNFLEDEDGIRSRNLMRVSERVSANQ